jgi:serine/threonine-protein kinase 24/25/MST4
LQHRFIRGARKTSYLTELIEKYQEHRAKSPPKPQANQVTMRGMTWDAGGTVRSEWNFDTIRSSASAMGTFRTMAKELSMAGPPVDEAMDEIFDEDEESPRQSSIDTGAATKGSDPIFVNGGLGTNPNAVSSTVIIKPAPGQAVPSSSSPEKDVNELLAEEGPSSTPEDVGDSPPPAYNSPAVRSGSRRSSYAARNDARGTLMREADLGNGIDTIRPIKKLDAAGSLRLSNDFVGSMRREASNSSGQAPSSPTAPHKRTTSETAKAGRSMVDEVVLPILQKVIFKPFHRFYGYSYFRRRLETIWMHEKLSP